MKRVFRVGALALLLAAGCGWHAGLELPPEARAHDVHSLGIEIFGNTTAERDLEPELHAQLTRASNDMLALPLVAPRQADMLLRGRIVEYRRRGGVRNQDNELLETGLRIAVEADLALASGEVLRSTIARVWSGYIVGGLAPETEARKRVFEHLSQRILLDLFGPGGPPPGVLQEQDYEAPESQLGLGLAGN